MMMTIITKMTMTKIMVVVVMMMMMISISIVWLVFGDCVNESYLLALTDEQPDRHGDPAL